MRRRSPRSFWTFTVQEDADLQNEINRLLPDTLTNTDQYIRNKLKLADSEAVTAGRSVRRNALRSRWSPSRMRWERRERRRKEAIPAALRSLVYTCTEAGLPQDQPPLWQVPPKRWTAKSGFAYPAFLEEYGVSVQDWELFTEAFVRSAHLSFRQMLSIVFISLPIHLTPLVIPFPWNILIEILDPAPLIYISLKKRNTRNRVRDGTIPAWTAYWNMTYFGPKGLTVGFDLPGCRFDLAEVLPRPHKTPWFKKWIGPFREPMSEWRMAKYPRITIAETTEEAQPDKGRIPELQTQVPRFHKFSHRARAAVNPLRAWRKRKAEFAAIRVRTAAQKEINDRHERLEAEQMSSAQAVLAEEPTTDLPAEPLEKEKPLTALAQEPATRVGSEHESLLSSEEWSSLTTVVEAEEPPDSHYFRRVLAHGRWIDEMEGRSRSA